MVLAPAQADAAGASISNPRVIKTDDYSTSKSTWDLVYFGKYPKNSYDGAEPILWRVLQVQGGKAFLVTDELIYADSQDCLFTRDDTDPNTNEYKLNLCWNNSLMRSFLNGYGANLNDDGISYSARGFRDLAFTDAETKLMYADNDLLDGDYVSILNAEQLGKEEYGFCSDYYRLYGGSTNSRNWGESDTRAAREAGGGSADIYYRGYWVRYSIYGDQPSVTHYTVGEYGAAGRRDDATYTQHINKIKSNKIGLRPCIVVDWYSPLVSYAGTVSCPWTSDHDITYDLLPEALPFGDEIINKLEVSLEYEKHVYTGSQLKPGVSVVFNDEELSEGTDYTVSYGANTAVGTGTVTVKSTGARFDEITKTFEITEPDPVVEPDDPKDPEEPGTSDKPAEIVMSWHGSGNSWWYGDDAGTNYYKSQWATIGGAKYHFDANGWMSIGWLQDGSTWYFLEDSGVMHTGWLWNGGHWYYFDSDGKMVTFINYIDHVRYLFADSGAMLTGWQTIGSYWYYFDASGAGATGWGNVGGVWYYFDVDGAMLTGWVNDNGVRYYMHDSGAMKTGWHSEGSDWYYLNDSGAMHKGWKNVGGTWYYMNNDGKMVTGLLDMPEGTYFMHDSGAMHTGWKELNSSWYCFDGSGAMMRNAWAGNYWLGSDGKMATSSWVDNGNYYVDENGVWVPNKQK